MPKRWPGETDRLTERIVNREQMTVTILLIGVRFSVRLNIQSRAKSLTAA